tara:strand:- start:301 stop:438 length:138 start_codon:yes stop_codon:yes gene_type:complete
MTREWCEEKEKLYRRTNYTEKEEREERRGACKKTIIDYLMERHIL